MDTIKISRHGRQWHYDAGAAGTGRADSLDMVTRRAGAAVASFNDQQPGQFASISWIFEDDFITDARLIGADRARLKRESDALEVRTRAEVVKLSDSGLGMRDISNLLGISAAKVSQIKTPGTVYVTDADSEEIEVVDLFTKKHGILTRYGRGPLPPTINYNGVIYEATGGSHGTAGGPTKHTYIPVD